MSFPAAVTHLATAVPAIAPLLENADHADVKTVTGPAGLTLREFLARAFSYQPAWMSALLYIRQGFVRLLRIPPSEVPEKTRFTADEVPLVPGENFLFFVTQDAEEEHYWIGCAEDKHLDAWIVVVVEPVDAHTRHFHLLTVVRYNAWTGPVYFNVIRPFHHLIVHFFAREGVKRVPARTTA
ncbi:MAG: DUF2867 domain-containing protein [Anaerolineae bacterium]|nr:DUF2867 domain-containing protein [Anaerolineae bacterium]